ncbi:Protein VTS1 [Bienertia sinuspersici]
MVELKRKHMAAVGSNNNNYVLENSSNIMADSDLRGEDGWIIVKKQRVNILIPRLPTIAQCNLEQDQPYGNMSSNFTKTQELEQEKSLKAQFTERNDEDNEDDAVPILKRQSPDVGRMTAEDQTENSRAFPERTKNFVKFQKASPKLVRPLMHSRLYGVCHLPTSNMNLNKKMRAWNLKRNISKAGGLCSWLSSLGLEQFLVILGAKIDNKFYLANLSMKKLKNMGAHAVGPRRKLIHAIECVCQPHCYELSKNPGKIG